jgi:alkylation response protein AidB-like acyl-CoA dehydrogenase
MSVHTLRRQDFSLSLEQQELREAFAAMFEKESPSARVRAAEPLGFDADLWRTLVAAGVISMGLPEASGGDGADLVDLVLVAEQFGRSVAPVPLVDAIVAARLLAASGAPAPMIDAVADGTKVAAVALHAVDVGERQLVSAGAVAPVVLGMEAGALVAVDTHTDALPPAVANLGAAPMAWRTLSEDGSTRVVLADGVRAHELHAHAVTEWKLLMAAAQTGIAQGALDLSIEYANQRHAFGVPIGTFQAISHSLVDVATGIEGSRHMYRRAAWFCEHEPLDAEAEVLMAYVHARETANGAASTGIHVQGGFGFTLESDLQLYFRRAKGWALVSGDPHDDLRALGDLCYGPRTPTGEG